jgi:DNA-binding Xre family transcriptional regulator
MPEVARNRNPEVVEFEKRFAFNLGRVRIAQKMSRRKLGEIAGIADHTMEHLEKGRRATIGEAVVLAEALGVKPGELLRPIDAEVWR